MQRHSALLVRGGVFLSLVSMLMLATGASWAAFAQGPAIVRDVFDRTRNLVVNSSDISDLASSWETVNEADRCTADSATDDDLNNDGCLDVADIQLLAANAGGVTTLTAPILNVAPNAVLDEKIFTVNTNRAGNPNTSGIKDSNPGDGVCKTSIGDCTLQAAVQEANARPGPDRIIFQVTTTADPCPTVIIRPGASYENWLQLDDMTGGTTIDGTTQCGALKNGIDVGSNASIKVELNGTVGTTKIYPSRLDTNGIEIKTANNVVRGIALHSWDRQIEITNATATNNHIEGNIIGSTFDQSFQQPKGPEHHREGIDIGFTASYNIIGCGNYADTVYTACTDKTKINNARNMVIGNGNDGIHLEGASVSFNRIVGNLVGLKGDGETALPNRSDAVDFQDGPSSNWLGGESVGERNVISGNGSEGIEISHTTSTQYNKVVGNYFGLNARGTRAIPNADNGVSFEDTVNKNEAYGNFISGNGQSGLRFYEESYENYGHNNWIGLAADKKSPIPNTKDGVHVQGGSHHNLVANNVIAFNKESGVDVTNNSDYGSGFKETFFNTISKNSIYSNAGKGIELSQQDGVRGNQGLKAPVLAGANTALAVGKACASCIVEVFVADGTSVGVAGQGKTFVGTAQATSAGDVAVPITGVKLGSILTATSTDDKGNTSEFAVNIAVSNTDYSATATVIAATAYTQATATSAAQQTATAAAQNAAATAAAATAAAEAAATSTAAAVATQAIGAAQTTTAIAIQTQPALAATATVLAKTAAPVPQPPMCSRAFCVTLPLVQR